MNTIPFEEALNSEQLRAVQAPDGPVLVIAAAGTGKTRTLTYRVAWLVEHHADPRRILLLTFTNRAAREMLVRAQALVGDAVGGMWGGTFHHTANRLLRRHAELLGYRNDFTILDDDDSNKMIKACLEELKLKDKHFPKAEVLQSVFGLAANREAPILETAEKYFDHPVFSLEDVARVGKAYEERKRRSSSMDFDDLLVNGLKLFREHEPVRQMYQTRFLHVLVDEYQDTNRLQADWVDLLAGLHRNLLVVGDDFQSIYSWRGADFRNIISFPERYHDCKMFLLETNYRSLPGILEVANACIAGNKDQFQKQLHAVRQSDQRPCLALLADGDQQARYVIQKARALIEQQGYKPNEIAVLYRAHYHALELQLELARSKLPFVVMSGMRFFEQAHIKDVCALLRLTVNPQDEPAFSRLVQLFPKVGKKKAEVLWRELEGFFNLRDEGKRERFAQLLPKEARAAWKPIEAALLAPAAGKSIWERPDEMAFRFTREFYREYAIETFDNYDNRLDDLEELVRFAAGYESTRAFISETALLTNLDQEQNTTAGMPLDAIRLTTIHQAKGLEWRAVFIIWLADGLFPPQRSLLEATSEAEERRLFYVAVTRARDCLHLCVPQMRRQRDGSITAYRPSRFIEEIDLELFQTESRRYY